MKKEMKFEKEPIMPLKENPTSLDAIEKINEILKWSNFSEDALKQAETALNVFAKVQNISNQEALILAAIVEIGSDGTVNCKDLARFFNCSNVKVRIYSPVIDSLIEKGYLRSYDNRREGKHFVPAKAFLQSIMDNKRFEIPSKKNLDLRIFLKECSKILDDRYEYQLDYRIFINEVKRIILDNSHLPLCKYLETNFLYDKDRNPVMILILRACILAVLFKEGTFPSGECNLLLFDDIDRGYLKNDLEKLTKKGNSFQVFEPSITFNNPLASSDFLSLTSQFCKKYLEGLNIDMIKVHFEVSDEMIKSGTIVPKKLFYNADEEKRITELSKLLKPLNFKRIQKRLKEYGYRQGFAVLFYGTPGTGKTETAMQLARATGRNIIPVDLSQIRDKYVGESEKRTKAIFDDYRETLEQSKVAPILLLNEADGLLSKRISSIDHSTDQMENTMQNILLQELETFEGIMIATTNLTCNLDSAFERRFLYKIEFHKPSSEARQSIWRTMIHDLKPTDAKIIAEEFDFSGGEIENIARKYVVNMILHDAKTDINSLREMCRTERLSKADNRKRIGF